MQKQQTVSSTDAVRHLSDGATAGPSRAQLTQTTGTFSTGLADTRNLVGSDGLFISAAQNLPGMRSHALLDRHGILPAAAFAQLIM